MAEENGFQKCERCGDRVENGRSAVCYACFLDGLIPNPTRYYRREEYAYTEAHSGGNATKHPPTGNKLLDSTPLRISQVWLPKGLELPW